MNTVIKKILDRFIISVTVIITVTVVLMGKVTTEQKGMEVFTAKRYETVMLKNTRENVEIKTDDKIYNIKKDVFNNIDKYEKYVLFSPFAAIYCTAENIKELIEKIK